MQNKVKKQGKWIWYPFDYEIWLGEKLLTRRDLRETILPPFWRMDSHYKSVKFCRTVDVHEEETITVESIGEFSFKIDSDYQYDKSRLVLPKGQHMLLIEVYSSEKIPAIKISGTTVFSDESWDVHNGDMQILKAASGEYMPDGIPFCMEEIFPRKIGDNLWDFGKETFGYIKLDGIQNSGTIMVCYGESMEEALSAEECETFDRIRINDQKAYQHTHSRACRYVRIVSEDVEVAQVSLMYEYLPVQYRGAFNSSDELLNRIWKTALYTLHLNTREFFIDGIKRDRWVWCGDSYQSFLMNYYTFFDSEVCKRTLILLPGKEPINRHINHIPDYTFYWFISLYDYYVYTGNLDFIKACYAKSAALMDYCLSRRDENGYVDSREDDWVFLDWADMDKSGVLCAEQILFLRSVEMMSIFSRLTGMGDSDWYYKIFSELKEKILKDFWTDTEGLKHSNRLHKPTKYANIFALMYRYLSEEDQSIAVDKSLKNPKVMKITTPYARFYEMDALCQNGEQKYVLDEMKRYWGGMLQQGATTFWEEYNEAEQGTEHLSMYGRPFGKSLCHAWGASPLYLLGKYFLGVRPLSPGYEMYEIDLCKCSLDFIEGSVPTPKGDIQIYYSNTKIKIKGIPAKGILKFRTSFPVSNPGCRLMEDGAYEFELKDDSETIIELSPAAT